jgi:hypothetical protein
MEITKANKTKLDQSQSQIFRRIFSAPRNTSKNAMIKLLQIIPLSDRADHLLAKFHSKLTNTNDNSIPACAMAKHVPSRIPWVESKTLNPTKMWEILTSLDADTGKSVSNSICMAKTKQPIHHALTADAFPDQKTRKTILTWLIGGVARHQLCLNCNNGTTLSREHALDCSGAGIYLHQTFVKESKQFLDKELGNTPIRLTFMDYILHEHRHTPNELAERWQFYNRISHAIGKIYKLCLSFAIDQDGFWKNPQSITLAPLTASNTTWNNERGQNALHSIEPP